MTTRRSFDLARLVGSLTLLAALLGPGARALPAQEAGATPADTTPLDLVFVVFPAPTGAGEALASMDDTQRQNLESYAVVSKDDKGSVKVGDKKSSQTVDGVVALLGRPAEDSQAQTQDQSDTSGYAPGGAPNTSGVSDADMSQMSGMLDPGSSALVLVVEDPNADALESSMREVKGQPEIIVVDVVPVEE